MAKNKERGKGRVGCVKKRDQVKSPRNKRWTKRETAKKQFIDQKFDRKPFKGVRKKK